MSEDFIAYILDYLDEHLYSDLSIDELSMYFGYDKTYLMKSFKSYVGVSIKSYINIKKILNSIGYLDNDSLLLKVALESGFNSLEYYSEMFTKIMGVSPRVFRSYMEGNCSIENLLVIKDSLEKCNNLDLRVKELHKTDVKVLRLAPSNEKKKCA